MSRFITLVSVFFFSCNASVTGDRGNAGMFPGEVKILTQIQSIKTGEKDASSAEVLAYDEKSRRLFVVNSLKNQLDIIDLTSPEKASVIRSVPLAQYGGGVNSVASKNGYIALAVENTDPLKDGWVLLMNAEGEMLKKVRVGVMPDMVTFTPDGKFLLTANEGEPDATYTSDPEGSVSLIDISSGIENLNQDDVYLIPFTAYNDSLEVLRKRGVRIYGPGATVAQDLEPEYIAVSPDSRTAFVTLQENNALAIIDIETRKILDIRSFGLKDFSAEGCGLDASDKKGDVKIACCPVKGMYQPDAINAFEVEGVTYLITANEGEIREYDGFTEETRIKKKDYILDPFTYANGNELKSDEEMGRLKVSRLEGDNNKDGMVEQMVCFGARSFSIWTGDGSQVYDSGNLLEKITSAHPASADFFNASNSSDERFSRSDDKGPEPEGVTTAKIGGKIIAFITLERVGGVMAFDVSRPRNPKFLQYVNDRAGSGDLGPETVLFISAAESPDDRPLLLVANEVSSTVGIYRVSENF